MKKQIPVNAPDLSGNEKKYLAECIDSGWISSEGPFVKELEERFALKMGRKYGIAVCNGSVALDAAIIALGIQAGDEVIMPSFTIISCASAIVRAGGIPVLVDSDPITWNMDPTAIEKRITARTKAIMVVHIYGLPVDMDPILHLAQKHSLKIIEDAAEEFGQTYRGKPVGSFGDVSCFSFYSNKHITTGEGGMIATDSEKIAEHCRSLRNLCFNPARRFRHEEIGNNFRMTNFQAAIGLAQLERFDQFILKKRHIGQVYNQHLQGNPHLDFMPAETEYAKNIYWVYGVVLKDHVNFDAEEAIKRLQSAGIGCRPFFWPMHEQPIFQKMNLFSDEFHPVAERIARRGFYIPSGLTITDEEMGIVADELKAIFK